MLHYWWSGDWPDTGVRHWPSMEKGQSISSNVSEASLCQMIHLQHFFMDRSLFNGTENSVRLVVSYFQLSKVETFHRPFNTNPTLCLWPLTCQLIPSCISNLPNEWWNTGTDGWNRGGDCGRRVNVHKGRMKGEFVMKWIQTERAKPCSKFVLVWRHSAAS